MASRGKRVRRNRPRWPRHARFYLWEIESEAFRSLSCAARCLLLEFKIRFNGENNGQIGMGVRQAARLLNRSPGHIMEVFEELEDKGFIKRRTPGTRPRGQGAAIGQQTEWSLTEYDYNGQPATKDFMSWQAPEESEDRPPQGTSRSLMEHLSGGKRRNA